MEVTKAPLSDFQIDERAAEARNLLENTLLNEALDTIYSKAVTQLLNVDVGSLTAATAHAMMKAIPAVRSQLESYVNDAKMRQKHRPKG